MLSTLARRTAANVLVCVCASATVACSEAPSQEETTPLPAICGTADAVACFARLAQARVEECYTSATASPPAGARATVALKCVHDARREIDPLYRRARAEALWLRGVTADLNAYYGDWRDTLDKLQAASPGPVRNVTRSDIDNLEAQSRDLLR